ncbi:hypothetical protein ABK040_011130 [Willaertia magna]
MFHLLPTEIFEQIISFIGDICCVLRVLNKDILKRANLAICKINISVLYIKELNERNDQVDIISEMIKFLQNFLHLKELIIPIEDIGIYNLLYICSFLPYLERLETPTVMSVGFYNELIDLCPNYRILQIDSSFRITQLKKKENFTTLEFLNNNKDRLSSQYIKNLINTFKNINTIENIIIDNEINKLKVLKELYKDKIINIHFIITHSGHTKLYNTCKQNELVINYFSQNWKMSKFDIYDEDFKRIKNTLQIIKDINKINKISLQFLNIGKIVLTEKELEIINNLFPNLKELQLSIPNYSIIKFIFNTFRSITKIIIVQCYKNPEYVKIAKKVEFKDENHYFTIYKQL